MESIDSFTKRGNSVLLDYYRARNHELQGQLAAQRKTERAECKGGRGRSSDHC